MSTDTSPRTYENVGFEEVDWDELDGGRIDLSRRGAGLLVSLLGLAAAFAYDYFLVPSREALAFGLDPKGEDWLFVLTLLLGAFYVVPLYQNRRMTAYYWRRFRRNRAAVLSLVYLAFILVVGIVGPYVVGRPELDFANSFQPPVGFGGTWAHPFGTARTGEDIFQIVVVGMRVSMQVGLTATMISVLLASIVGTTAAFSGGWVDEVLMRFVDLMMTFPTFFLILLLVYIYGGSLFLLILILSFTGWGGIARLVRSEALQRSEEAYIRAAESAGATKAYIIRRHIMPNVSNTIITAATLSIPGLILFEAIIAFLGLGDPDVWSWGRVIAQGRNDLQNAWWISTIPGLFLFTTVLAFNFLGDALRDALDPRHE